MAPRKRIRVLFDQYAHRLEQGLPLVYEVKLRYQGPTGKRNRMRWHEDDYRLDMGIYLGASPPPKGLPDLVNELETIRKDVHKWTDGTGSLHVSATDSRKRERRRQRIDAIQRGKRILETEGALALVRWVPGKAKRILQLRGWL